MASSLFPRLFDADDARNWLRANGADKEFVFGPGLRITPLARDVLVDAGVQVRYAADAEAGRPPGGLEILDISMTVRPGMPEYPGLPPYRIDPVAGMETGSAYNAAVATIATHLGTHVDGQCHHYQNGKGVDALPMEGLVGIGCVLDVTTVRGGIRAADLLPLDGAGVFDVLLLKTANSVGDGGFERFNPAHSFLEPDAALDIVRRGIKGLATDCLSVEQFERPGAPVHKILLRDNRIVIIEGVDLRGVTPGRYWFACLPVKLQGADGAPARAILVRDPSGILLQVWERSVRRPL